MALGLEAVVVVEMAAAAAAAVVVVVVVVATTTEVVVVEVEVEVGVVVLSEDVPPQEAPLEGVGEEEQHLLPARPQWLTIRTSVRGESHSVNIHHSLSAIR